jgi:hypothetical protein
LTQFIIIIIIIIVVVIIIIIIVIVIVVIIIIIIIIGKTALFEPYPFLEDFAQLHPVFTSLDFATMIFL